MPSNRPFHRDPREVEFLRDQVKQALALANDSSRGVLVREDDDFGFMAMQFLYKQMQHAESILLLAPSRDAGLIARTMIDGLYQLLWAYQEPQDRAKRWRTFSIIHDWRIMQGRLKLGIPVDAADVRHNEARMEEVELIHRLPKSKSNAVDPYYRNWRGGVTLSAMADAIGRELYDGPYSELSDWEHWGVAGIGDSITRQDGHLTVNPNSERVAGLSFLAAFQCLLQTLEVADNCFSLGIKKRLHDMGETFRTTIDSFYEVGSSADGAEGSV